VAEATGVVTMVAELDSHEEEDPATVEEEVGAGAARKEKEVGANEAREEEEVGQGPARLGSKKRWGPGRKKGKACLRARRPA
jgi:hypothetical protein